MSPHIGLYTHCGPDVLHMPSCKGFLSFFLLFHHAKTNDMFLPSGRVGPSPITRADKIEIFLVETLVLHIGFRLPSDFTSTMYLYREQTVTEYYHGIKYSLHVSDVSFRNFIDNFRNVEGAQALVANITFQEEIFKLEQSGKPPPNQAKKFKPPPTLCYQ